MAQEKTAPEKDMKKYFEIPIHNIYEPHYVALFANHKPGLKIAEFLSQCAPYDQVRALYLTGDNPSFDQEIIDALGIENERVFIGPDTVKDESHIAWLKEQDIDSLICVYWPWLLKDSIFSLAKKTINFHPALLPINRGWFPHVHSLIDGSKTGVTLHMIDEGADTGDIWAQNEVLIQPTDTAKEIYERLQDEIVSLFKSKWGDIKNGEVTAVPQNHADAVYHSKKEISSLDLIDPNALYKASDLINKLRARSFGNKGFAFVEENGRRYYLNIRISESTNFE